MTPDQRYDLIDCLPEDMVIWDDDEELDAFPWDLRKWMDALGHQKAHLGCCKSCGCATTCMASAFRNALVASVVRELDKLGALHAPGAGLVVVSAEDLRSVLDLEPDGSQEFQDAAARLRAALPERSTDG